MPLLAFLVTGRGVGVAEENDGSGFAIAFLLLRPRPQRCLDDLLVRAFIWLDRDRLQPFWL